MWLNHANNCAQFARKPLILLGWRMSGLSPVDTDCRWAKLIDTSVKVKRFGQSYLPAA